MNSIITFDQLINEADVSAYEATDKLNHLLSRQPPKHWIKKHPIIKKTVVNEEGKSIRVPYEYLPIDRIEYLLRKIFGKFDIEVKNVIQIFNGVCVTVRVHYRDIATGDWRYHDGVGAVQLQTKSGASASDFSQINNGAITMAVPHAKTLAIKDACDMFGDLFGANLNRDDSLVFESDQVNRSILDSLLNDAQEFLTSDEFSRVSGILENNEAKSFKKAITFLKSKIKENEQH